MKQQFVVIHTIPQTEIPALLDSWVTNTPSVKCCVHKKIAFSLHFSKSITCLHVSLLRICKVFSLTCKSVYLWVTTNCCFMSNVLYIFHHVVLIEETLSIPRSSPGTNIGYIYGTSHSSVAFSYVRSTINFTLL
jgi:hypothetical protein